MVENVTNFCQLGLIYPLNGSGLIHRFSLALCKPITD